MPSSPIWETRCRSTQYASALRTATSLSGATVWLMKMLTLVTGGNQA